MKNISISPLSAQELESFFKRLNFSRDSEHIKKYSFLLLDHIINIAIDIQKLVAINHVYLVPISDKMRAIYNEYGFVNIPGSGKNEYEDYMVFNLLDEDPTLL